MHGDIDRLVPVIVVSEQLTIAGWSAGAEELTGLPRREVEGKACWDVLRLRRADGTAICAAECAVHQRALAGTCAIESRVLLRPDVAGGREVSVVTMPLDVGSSRMVAHVLVHSPAPGMDGEQTVALSPRQLDVLHRLEAGLATKEIARELGLSPHTVRNHVQAILRALGVPTRARAINRARSLGLL